MNIVKVGNKRIVFSNSFFIPEGDDAFFSCEISETDIMTCKIKFIYEDDTEGQKNIARVQGDFDNEIFTLTFFNFTSATGTSISKPFIFAASDEGEDISLMARVIKLKNMMNVSIQVMLGNIK